MDGTPPPALTRFGGDRRRGEAQPVSGEQTLPRTQGPLWDSSVMTAALPRSGMDSRTQPAVSTRFGGDRRRGEAQPASGELTLSIPKARSGITV